MSDSILVHNPGPNSQVYTSNGKVLSVFKTAEAPADDPVTARLVAAGRLIVCSEPQTMVKADDRPCKETITMPADDGDTSATPAGNATREAWSDYAVTQGLDPSELEPMSRNEIRDLFLSPPEGGDTSSDQATDTGVSETPTESEKEK